MSPSTEDAGSDQLRERMRRFARESVRPYPGLGRPGPFPHDLWAAMARQGLLSVGTPRAQGGLEVSLAEQAALVSILAREGRSLGFAVAWQSHNTLSRFFFAGFGSPAQQARWLPELAAGRISPAVAVSEPGAGAHPKHLRTEAARDGGGYRLNGEKAFVTNGTLAGLFVVLAITAVEAGRKRFTAFLVERGTPGLSFTEAGHVDGLYPVGHCGLRFENCRVGEEAVLGPEGTAFETMGQPLRDHEDLLGIGTLTGGMRAGLDMLSDAAAAGSFVPDDDTREAVGLMVAATAAVSEIGRGVLSGQAPDAERSTLLIAARHLVRDYLGQLERIAAAHPALPPEIAILRRDLGILGGVARQVVRLRLRRLADSVLSRQA
jgi:acyl-CoA dehydrogenase